MIFVAFIKYPFAALADFDFLYYTAICVYCQAIPNRWLSAFKRCCVFILTDDGGLFQQAFDTFFLELLLVIDQLLLYDIVNNAHAEQFHGSFVVGKYLSS